MNFRFLVLLHIIPFFIYLSEAHAFMPCAQEKHDYLQWNQQCEALAAAYQSMEELIHPIEALSANRDMHRFATLRNAFRHACKNRDDKLLILDQCIAIQYAYFPEAAQINANHDEQIRQTALTHEKALMTFIEGLRTQGEDLQSNENQAFIANIRAQIEQRRNATINQIEESRKHGMRALVTP